VNLLRSGAGSLAATAIVLVAALLVGGPGTLAVVLVLGVMEVTLSFDNAVVNAVVVRRLSPFWQRMFLTVGVLIAVVGMRLVLPLAVVAITGRLSPDHVLRLAINDPTRYSLDLRSAHPAIAAFGGSFLLMIFLEFVFADRDIRWLRPLERFLAWLGQIDRASLIVMLPVIVVCAEVEGGPESTTILVAGVLGIACNLLVNGLSDFAESLGDGEPGEAVLTGRRALLAFCYLELLDASFSFDGVVGAFAVSSNLFVIAAGLGIGALYVRTLTIQLVRRGVMDSYLYLEHGAHYAIGALGVLLLVTIGHPVSNLVTGLVGMFFIVTALISSVLHNRRPHPHRA
jgi:uncharacterized protein